MSNPALPVDSDGLASPPDQPLLLGQHFARFVRVLQKPKTVIRLHGFDAETERPYAPVFFSVAGRSRWDHPNGPGTLCVGLKMDAALFEVFGGTWPSVLVKQDPLRQRFLSWKDQQTCFRTHLTLPAGLRLLNLTQAGLLNLVGTDGLLLSSRHYAKTQEWGRWFGACSGIDGLIYSSRPGGSSLVNVALFKRRGLTAALERSQKNTKNLAQLGEPFRQLLKKYHVIVGTRPVPPKG